MQAEQRLFLGVIIQLIEDYAVDMPVGANKTESRLAKIHAETWFRQNTADYKEVCDSAGVDSVKLRKRVLSSTPSDLQGLLDEYRTLYLSNTLRN